MNIRVKNEFIEKWQKYFGKSELPVTFYFSDGTGDAKQFRSDKLRSCFICDMAKARKGLNLYFNAGSVTCGGGKRYLGYTDKLRPGFEYFLSCGNKNIEGERYLKSPEMVTQFLKRRKYIPVHTKNIIFKRWDKLTEKDNPEVVIFFAKPDILAGLYTLAGYDHIHEDAVITPFGAGCATIVQYPLLEKEREHPRGVIGMFDSSARPCVQPDVLTFAVPIKKFLSMMSNMDESFLITDTWKKMKKRIDKTN